MEEIKWLNCLYSSSALKEVDHYHDNGNDQQDVDKSAHGVAAHQPQKPENDEDYD